MIISHNGPQVSTGSSQIAAFNAMHSSAIGIDVHSTLMVACFQKGEFGSSSFTEEFKESGTSLNAIRNLVIWCSSKNPDIIIMESTGIYWKTLYTELEKSGFPRDHIIVINPRILKPLKGRKTDRSDARNLAGHARMGSFTNSFIPKKDIRELRSLWASFQQIKHQYENNRRSLLNSLADYGCQFANIVSNSRGVTAQMILDAILTGDTGDALKKRIREILDIMSRRPGRKLVAGLDQICEAIESNITPAIRMTLQMRSQQLKIYEEHMKKIFDIIKVMVINSYKELYDLLATIPGAEDMSVIGIICIVGDDLSSFSSIKKFSSWSGLAPGNNISAGVSYSSRITHGNKYFRRCVLAMAQACANQKKNRSGLGNMFQRLRERKGYNKAKVAVAHKIVRIIYVIITRKVKYAENPNDQSLAKFRMDQVKRAISRAKVTEGLCVKSETSNQGKAICASVCMTQLT